MKRRSSCKIIFEKLEIATEAILLLQYSLTWRTELTIAKKLITVNMKIQKWNKDLQRYWNLDLGLSLTVSHLLLAGALFWDYYYYYFGTIFKKSLDQEILNANPCSSLEKICTHTYTLTSTQTYTHKKRCNSKNICWLVIIYL